MLQFLQLIVPKLFFHTNSTKVPSFICPQVCICDKCNNLVGDARGTSDFSDIITQKANDTEAATIPPLPAAYVPSSSRR